MRERVESSDGEKTAAPPSPTGYQRGRRLSQIDNTAVAAAAAQNKPAEEPKKQPEGKETGSAATPAKIPSACNNAAIHPGARRKRTGSLLRPQFSGAPGRRASFLDQNLALEALRHAHRLKKFGVGVIMPSSKGKHYWDLGILLAVLYTSTLVPVEVAFDEDFGLGIFILNIFIDAAFITDIVLTFRTAYLDEWGNLIVDVNKIKSNYLSGWFLLDLGASIPFDLLLLFIRQFADSSDSNEEIYSWLGVLKIYRLLRFGRILKMLKNMKHANAFRIIRLLLGYLMVAHLVGCGWYMVNRLETGSNTWLELEVTSHGVTALQTKYFMSFYAGMLMLIGETVDVFTGPEKIFHVMTNLVGASMTAVIFGNVAALVASIGANQAVCRQKLETIVERMRFLNVPAVVQEKIRNYYEYLFITRGGMDDGLSFLQEVSPNMRHEINQSLHSDVLFKLGFLDSVRGTADFNNICDEIASALKSRVYLPMDYVFHDGDIGLECFVIATGTVLILTALNSEDNDQENYYFLEAGQVFGEMALLDMNEGKIHRRNHSARAETFCDVFVLEKAVVETVANRYPDFQDGWMNWLSDRKVNVLSKTISTWLATDKAPEAILKRFIYRWQARKIREREVAAKKLKEFKERMGEEGKAGAEDAAKKKAAGEGEHREEGHEKQGPRRSHVLQENRRSALLQELANNTAARRSLVQRIPTGGTVSDEHTGDGAAEKTIGSLNHETSQLESELTRMKLKMDTFEHAFIEFLGLVDRIDH